MPRNSTPPRSKPLFAAIFAEKFASTRAAALSTQPTAPTTAKFPIGVVVPRDKEDVLATVALCRDHRAPLLARGGGTSLAGQCCNAAVILDFSKYMASILEIDPARRIARVEPGVVLDTLRAAAEKHHLTFAPDPATHDRCTLGGMIGNNSCGVHSIMAGKTDDNIEALEILTYGGQRMHVGATSDEDFDRFIREGGRRAEIYTGLKSLADRYGEQVRRQFPEHSAPRFRIQPQPPAPRKRLSRGARAGRLRRHLRHDSRSHLPPGRESAGAGAARHRMARYLSSAPTTSRRSWSIAPSASKVLTTSWSTPAAAKA